MLLEFLVKEQKAILALAEKKTLELAGIRSSSEQLRRGLPIFYSQLMIVLQTQRGYLRPEADREGVTRSAGDSDESAMAAAGRHPEDVAVARDAGHHGVELQRLGYTLSHVVHAYGAMCQAIMELATQRGIGITSDEFQDLNRCLDVAIAGAVTEFQSVRNAQEKRREIKHIGFLAHELRNALAAASLAFQLIKRGTVGFGGSTAQVLDRSFKRLEFLIDQSLADVRMSVDPEIHPERINLLRLVDEIVVTAQEPARDRNQSLELHIDSALAFEADLQLVLSALSNLIQNALKYSRAGAVIQVRGRILGKNVVIEVEDECGGLPPETESGLFKPFTQGHKSGVGLGLGLVIARRAIVLNHGTLEVLNQPPKGCIFRIVLPTHAAPKGNGGARRSPGTRKRSVKRPSSGKPTSLRKLHPPR